VQTRRSRHTARARCPHVLESKFVRAALDDDDAQQAYDCASKLNSSPPRGHQEDLPFWGVLTAAIHMLFWGFSMFPCPAGNAAS
jgi:hypothetical protein